MSLQTINRQSSWAQVVSRISLCGVLAIALMATGCVITMPNSVPPVAPAAPPTSSAPTYKVILSSGRTPKIVMGKLDRATTVQQALVQSGANSQFKSMRVDVARLIPATGEVLKMPVKFDTGGKIFDEYDYAVHPGDEILVRPAQSNSMLNSLMGK